MMETMESAETPAPRPKSIRKVTHEFKEDGFVLNCLWLNSSDDTDTYGALVLDKESHAVFQSQIHSRRFQEYANLVREGANPDNIHIAGLLIKDLIPWNDLIEHPFYRTGQTPEIAANASFAVWKQAQQTLD